MATIIINQSLEKGSESARVAHLTPYITKLIMEILCEQFNFYLFEI